jgi:hypothetical protein
MSAQKDQRKRVCCGKVTRTSDTWTFEKLLHFLQ